MAFKSTRFRIGPEPMKPEDMNRWLEAQMPYENLVDQEEVAERARKFTTDKVVQFQQQAQEIHDKWETLDFMLRGNSISKHHPGSWIHVPLLYNAAETLVPMLVDSIKSIDPWFSVQGRDRHDRQRAKKIEAWLRYQNDLTRLPYRLEEIARTLITYQFYALKTGWKVQYRNRVIKNATRSVKDGFPVWDIKSERGDELVYEGNTFEIVRPYMFFCDTSRTDPQEMQYIGDISDPDEQEIADLANQGVYDPNQVDKVFEKLKERGEGHHTALQAHAAMRRRSLGSNQLFGNTSDHRGKGQPARLERIENWCSWKPDPGQSEEYREYVLTVINDIPVRVQENFYDDKHRPYAIARAAMEPFDFFNVGVLDQAIALSMECDDNRNLGYESHRRHVNPPIFVSPDSDAPSNIFEYEGGQTFHSKDGIHTVAVPSTLSDMIAFEQVLRRDIEQTTGAFGAFEGGTESNTATEYERKVQLRNLRNRRLVFSFADGLRQLQEQFYANTQQFVTYRKPFRVLGADAMALDIDYEITPEDIADPVDIIITGPDRLQTYGLRATQIASFMTQWAPIIPALVQQRRLNLPALFEEAWLSTFGYRLGENVLSVPRQQDAPVPAAEENLVLLSGGTVEVHPLDDDDEHDAVHEAAQEYAQQQGDLSLVQRIAEHRDAHEMQTAQKRARRKMEQNPERGPFEGGDMNAARHAPAEGREFQRTPDLFGDVTRQTPSGETPGPARMGAMGAMDREQPIPQSENR